MPDKSRLNWIALVLVLALGAGMFFFMLGDSPLSDRDEGEYAASVAAMVRNSDYVVPTLNGRHYLEKPILLFWLMAGSQAMFGEGEFAFRLPSAAAGVLSLFFVVWLVWRISGSAAWAALSGAAFAFTPLTALVGRSCLTDMPLTLFTTISLGCFFLASEKEPPKDRIWYLAAWAGLGLAFLTKGPVAPAVVLPGAVIYALVERRFLAVLKRAQIHWGLLIFLLINLPWFGLIFYRLGQEFWQAFFVSQNLRRFSEVLLGHGGGFVYYLPVLLVGGFPFFSAALAGLGSALAKNPRKTRQEDPAGRLRIFAAVCALVVLVVFSLAATKQINYIMPAFPFLGLLAGYELWRFMQEPAPGRLASGVIKWGLVICSVIWAVVMLALPVGLPLFWDKVLASIRFDSSEYALPAQAPLLVLWPVLGILAALGLAYLVIRAFKAQNRSWLGWGLCAGGLAFSALLIIGLLAQVSGIIQEPARRMAREAVAAAGADENTQMVTYGLWKPSLFYYTGRDLKRIRSDKREELSATLAQDKPVLVFTRVRLRDSAQKDPAMVAIKDYGGYLLAGNQAGAAFFAPQAAGTPKEADK